MSSSGVYFIGFLVLLGGLAYGAIMLGVPQLWVGIGAVVLLGIGIMSTVTSTRQRESSGAEGTTTIIREE